MIVVIAKYAKVMMYTTQKVIYVLLIMLLFALDIMEKIDKLKLMYDLYGEEEMKRLISCLVCDNLEICANNGYNQWRPQYIQGVHFCLNHSDLEQIK
jgi:hypothetical protein